MFSTSTTEIHSQVDMILQKLGGLLQQCSRTRASKSGLSVHSILVKMGLEDDLFICNHLINMYAKCNNFESAHRIFNGMRERNLISWSALIAGYDQAGRHTMAIDFFTRMKLQANEYIYASILSSCGSLSALPQGKQVHAHALKRGYNNISFVSNSLMSMYMKCDCFENAFSIFSNLQEPNSISYKVMITGFVENSQVDRGLELFKLMRQQGLQTDR
nr:pentatricopeptide repeat protein AaPPR1216 [Agave angustifolia]